MVRKTTRALTVGQSPFLDSGTAQVLNAQLLPVLSKDIVGFFVVGSVSVLFAALFIFLPLHRTKRGEKSWPAMSWFLLYFSCLGAGFIMIELTLIQLCTRLIGHPFIIHVEEFKNTRYDEEKIRTVLFPQEINSMFGIKPIRDSLMASTESLEELMQKFKKKDLLEEVVLGINKP